MTFNKNNFKNLRLILPVLLSIGFLNCTFASGKNIKNSSDLIKDDKNNGCPAEIIPGVSLGPVKLEMSKSELENLGFGVKEIELDILKIGNYFVKINDGKVTSVWIEDIRQSPNCFLFNGKKLPRNTKREKIISLFGSYKMVDGNKGGQLAIFSSGVLLGWSYDNSEPFLRLEILKK